MVLWEMESPNKRSFPMVQQHHKNTKMTHRLHSFVGHGGPVWCLDFEGDTMVSGSYDKTVMVWSIRKGDVKCTLRGHTGWVSSIKLHNNRILSSSWDSNLKLWELADNESKGQNDEKNDRFGFVRDNHEEKKTGRSRGRCVATLIGDAGNAVYCHQWDTVSNRVITGCRHNVLQVWDLNTARMLQTYMGHTKQVYSLHFDDVKLVSASGDHAIKLWDVKTGRCEMTMTGHANPVMSVQFDDEKIVSASYDKTVKIWDIRTGQILTTLEGHSSALFCMQFDQNRIITGSADRTIKIYDFNKPVYF